MADITRSLRAAGIELYQVTIPVVGNETRTLDIYIKAGNILPISSEYLRRVYNKSFSRWLYFASAMYKGKMIIRKVFIVVLLIRSFLHLNFAY